MKVTEFDYYSEIHKDKLGIEPNIIGMFRDPTEAIEGIKKAIKDGKPYDEYLLLDDESKKAWDDGGLVF